MINVKDPLITKELPLIGCDALAAFMAIASHLGKDGTRTAWPGMDRLRKMCPVEIKGELRPMPEKRMYAAIRRLIDRSLVERYQLRKENGDWDLRKYRLPTRLIEIYMGADQFELFEEEPEDSRLVELREAPNGEAPEREAPNDQTEAINKGEVSVIAEEAINWKKNGDERYQKAWDQLREHLNENPNKWKEILNMARVKITKEQFKISLQDWLHHNQDNYMIINDAVNSLTGGKSSFYSWLRQPWRMKDFEPTRAKRGRGNHHHNGTGTVIKYDGRAGR